MKNFLFLDTSALTFATHFSQSHSRFQKENFALTPVFFRWSSEWIDYNIHTALFTWKDYLHFVNGSENLLRSRMIISNIRKSLMLVNLQSLELDNFLCQTLRKLFSIEPLGWIVTKLDASRRPENTLNEFETSSSARTNKHIWLNIGGISNLNRMWGKGNLSHFI